MDTNFIGVMKGWPFTMIQGIQWNDLHTRGYVVVPAFLSHQNIEMILADYWKQPVSHNKNYAIKLPSPALLEQLAPQLRTIANHTETHATLIPGGLYFDTQPDRTGRVSERSPAFPWHQDHESWYLLNNHVRYLNCYIPVLKPVREKSNLSVLPWDQLSSRSMQAYRKLYGRGAHRLVVSGSTTQIFDDNNDDNNMTINFDVDQLSITPFLSAGDLLVLRGDTIHRTQDVETRRVALSVRMVDPDLIVHRSQLADGGSVKYQLLINNRTSWQCFLDTFDAAGETALSCRELYPAYQQYLEKSRGLPQVSVLNFLRALTRYENASDNSV
jgi:hypothetical protein